MRTCTGIAGLGWLAAAGLAASACDGGGGGQIWVHDAEGGSDSVVETDAGGDGGETDLPRPDAGDDVADDGTPADVTDDGPADDGPADETACTPSGAEFCDHLDNDCDGVTDPDDSGGCLWYYADADRDAHADRYAFRCSCWAPSDSTWVRSGGSVPLDDCDDGRADVHPDATEACDGLDNDCDGALDPSEDADGDGSASTACGGDDCDDGDASRYPGRADAAALDIVYEDPVVSGGYTSSRQLLGTPDGRVHVFGSGVVELLREPSTGAWSRVTIPGGGLSVLSARVMLDGTLGIAVRTSEDQLVWSDGTSSVDTGLTTLAWGHPMSLGITDAGNAWMGDRDEYGHELSVLHLQTPSHWTRDAVTLDPRLDGFYVYAAFRLPDGSPGLLIDAVSGSRGPENVYLASPGPSGWSAEPIGPIVIESSYSDVFVAGGVDAAGGLVVAIDDGARPMRIYRRPRGVTSWTLAWEEPVAAMRDGAWAADPQFGMGPSARVLYTTWDADWEAVRMRMVEPITGGVLATDWDIDPLRRAPRDGTTPGFLPDGRLAAAYYREGSGFRVAFLSRSVGDGVDSDCDGADLLDGDADGHAPWVAGGDDCDDGDASIHPGAADARVDGVDQDCDGMDGTDADHDLRASLGSGGDDCDDFNPRRLPTAFDGADLSVVREDLLAPAGYTWADADRWNGRPGGIGTATSAIGIARLAADGTWSVERVDTPTSAVAAPSYDPAAAGGFERQLIYYDSTADDLYWGGYAGGAWTIERADDVDNVGAVSQVVARTEGIQIVYSDSTSRSVRLARRTATGWTTERLSAGWPPDWMDLQRSPDGTPYLMLDDVFYHPDGDGWHGHRVWCGRAVDRADQAPALGFLLGVPYVVFADMPSYLEYHLHRQRFEGDDFIDETTVMSAGDAMMAAIDATGRFWTLFDRTVRTWDRGAWSDAIVFTMPFSTRGRMTALPDGSVEAVYVVSGRIERLRLSRPRDGLDANCDGVDGVDADDDGHASYDSGGDDCDDDDDGVLPGTADPAGDGIDADCDLLDG